MALWDIKPHVKFDSKTGLVNTVKSKVANVHDLLTGEETFVYGDGGYMRVDKRENVIVSNQRSKKIKYKINRRPSHIRNFSKSE